MWATTVDHTALDLSLKHLKNNNMRVQLAIDEFTGWNRGCDGEDLVCVGGGGGGVGVGVGGGGGGCGDRWC